jgi:hypothetical protein
MADKELRINLTGDSKDLEKALSSAQQKLVAFSGKMKDIGQTLSLTLTAPLALAGMAAINFAKDFNESLNKVDVAFKSSAGEVQAFAKTTLRSFGIAEGSALDMAANFGDMATSMGLTTQESATMSKSLVGLAGDLASFKNISIDIANTALTGIFTGETESLKRLGIVMTEQNVQMWALQNGIKKTFSEMSQAEKTMTRFKFVMAMTTNAQGDFERTGGGVANQMRILGEGLKQIGNEFGQVMLPTVNKIVKAMNSFINTLSATSSGTKTLIVILGSLAAAIGPVLFAFGLLTTNIIKGFATATTMVKGLFALIAANPLTAMIALVGTLTAAFIAYTGVLNKQKTLQQELIGINQRATESIAKEKNELERLVGIARNERVSKEERLKAIKAINNASPEYLKNITLDTINTDKAKKSIDNYNSSLLQKAKTQAAMAKIEEIISENLDLQTGKTNANMNAVQLLNYAMFKATGNTKYLAKAGAEYTAQLDKQISKNKELINEIAKTAGIDLNKVTPVETKKKAEKAYDPEAASKALKKAQKEEQRIQAERTKAGEQARDEYEKILGDINRENIKAGEETATMYLSQKDREYMILEESFAEQIALRERFKQSTIAISDKYRIEKNALDEKWNQIELQNITNQGDEAEALITAQEEQRIKNLEYYKEQIANSYAQLRDATASIFSDIGNSIISSFGPATSVLEQIGVAIGRVLVQMGALALAEKLFGAKAIKSKQAQATADSIKVGTAAAVASGPAGLALLAPFIASAMGMVTGAFATVPKFAAGGIVSGPTMGLMGEYPGAKSNPEVIAPLSKLQGMIDTGSGGNMNLTGEFVVRGSDLVLALQRAEKQKSRIG